MIVVCVSEILVMAVVEMSVAVVVPHEVDVLEVLDKVLSEEEDIDD